ncbi:MAG: hypothetical protein RIB80_04795 [Rhodospirillales bacterium]
MTDLFPDTVPDARIKPALTELRREIAMRERLYPQWVQQGRMVQAVADRQIAALKGALDLILENAQK